MHLQEVDFAIHQASRNWKMDPCGGTLRCCTGVLGKSIRTVSFDGIIDEIEVKIKTREGD